MSQPCKTACVPEFFRAFARRVSDFVGSSWAFAAALLTIVVWAAVGPFYHYSDTWQLFINTGTTVVTFLMVFVMQNTQNRDAKAIHLKLDELIRGQGSTHRTCPAGGSDRGGPGRVGERVRGAQTAASDNLRG